MCTKQWHLDKLQLVHKETRPHTATSNKKNEKVMPTGKRRNQKIVPVFKAKIDLVKSPAS